jgi:tetratricopeptide (TPR) repeat protein
MKAWNKNSAFPNGKGLIIACLLGFCLLACAVNMAPNYTVRAQSLTEGGQHDEAIKQAKQSVEIDPAYAPGWYWLGVAYYRKAQYDEAINAFLKVIALKPIGDQFQSSYNFLGWSYYLKGSYDEALNQFNRTLQINPNYHDSLRGRGWTYYRKHSLDLAIQDFNKAIVIQKDADSFMGRSWAYYEKGDLDQSIDDAKKVLELNPKDPLALRHLGSCYYNKGDLDQAIDNFNRSLEVNNKDPHAFSGRGHARFYKGQYREAIGDFNQVGENADPRFEGNKYILQDALRGKAYAYLGLGDGETAISLVKKAKETLDFDVNHDFSIIYYVLGNKEKTWEYRGGRGMVGLEVRDYKKGGVTGVEVVRVLPEGPAEKSGIMPGDVILRLNEVGPTNVGDFVEKSIRLTPGSKAKIKILREGAQKELFLPVASAEPLMDSNPVIASILSKKKERPAVVIARSEPRETFPPSSKLPPPRPDTHAIVIGIDYRQRQDIPHLQYAAQDAQKVFDLLTDPRFGGVAKENAFLLLNEKATRNEIVAALRKIRNWDGYVYVYYSGHGAPKTKDEKLVEGLLVPSDAIITDPESIEETSIKISYLKAAVESSPAKVLVALDACFSGGGKSVVPKGGKPLVGMLATPDLLQPKAKEKVIITSSAMNQQSWEDEKEMKGGIFSHFLIEGLTGRASKGAWTNINDLAAYVKENVPRAAKKLKGVEQIPQVSGEGNFPVARNWEKARFQDVETARARLKSAFESGFLTIDQLNRALDELKSQTHSKTLEAFLEEKMDARKFGELY